MTRAFPSSIVICVPCLKSYHSTGSSFVTSASPPGVVAYAGFVRRSNYAIREYDKLWRGDPAISLAPDRRALDEFVDVVRRSKDPIASESARSMQSSGNREFHRAWGFTAASP